MIETIEELIETYFLDKEIKDTDVLYSNFSKKMYDVYNNMRNYVFKHPMPKDNVNMPKDIVIKQQANAQQPKKEQQPAKNENKPVIKVNKEIMVENQNSGDKKENIESVNNNKITGKTVHINIVQNAYADGNRVIEDDEENNSVPKGVSAINNVNINFGNND